MAASACRTCDGLTFKAAMRSGFSQARSAKVRPPRMSAFCTPLHRRQPRLHHADEIVGHLVVLQDLRVEAQVHRRERGIRRLQADRRHLGLGGQIATHLIHARADVGQRARGVDVQLEANVDGGEPLFALRFDVVDAVAGGDGPLDGRGDEPTHQIGAGAHVGRTNDDGRALQARVLPDIERADGLHAGDDDDQVDDQGKDRPPYEDIGDAHALAVLGVRSLRARELDLVVHDERRSVAQLEGAQHDHLLPRGHPFVDGHEVTPG